MKRVLEVFDLDGVLVPESERMALDVFIEGAYMRVKPHRPELVLDEAFHTMSQERFYAHGCCIKGWAHDLGLSQEWVMDSYAAISGMTFERLKDKVKADPVMIEKLEKLKAVPGVKVVGLTQSDRLYCHPLVAHLGFDHVLPPEVLHDIRDVDGYLKRTEEPYQFLKERYPDFDVYRMTEDSPHNLPPAKRMGFETTFLGHKHLPDEVRPFVDYVFKDIHETLDFKLRGN